MAVMGTRHPARRRWKLWNAFTLRVLHTPLLERLAEQQVCELRFRARHSGGEVVLPVMYAQHDDLLVVLVGGPEGKRWWRNFTMPWRVEVFLRGSARSGVGHLVRTGSPQRPEAARIYGGRFPDLAVNDDPIVVIELDPVH
ncbi:hypothetical protein HDA40_007256 [Hamadaea flava]|uniref:Deazaflavin-dependent oxidoreductase (Nitroreductase family) n=1 Tax=Hamadaea flava TaxID=1742688 RepID=A0ABV8LT74_9ACTN|nr:hypothetical protein [Hamadaea flava]MCP2328749.1 hypothetical protein [Hamadaea flava]